MAGPLWPKQKVDIDAVRSDTFPHMKEIAAQNSILLLT
jgi:hypothetical protein